MFQIGGLFLLGVTSGLHCLGMCGPVVLTLQAPVMKERRWAGNLLFNLGRITTYAAVGTVLYLVASRAAERLPIANAKRALTLAVGIFLVLFGLWQFLPFRLPPVGNPQRVPGFAKISGTAFGTGRLLPVYLLGILLGFLPCGMTYGMYVRVLDGTNAAAAAGMALAFGLGTLPWLLLAGVFSNYLVGGLRKWGQILSGLVMIGLGVERVYHALTVVSTCPYH